MFDFTFRINLYLLLSLKKSLQECDCLLISMSPGQKVIFIFYNSEFKRNENFLKESEETELWINLVEIIQYYSRT